MVEDEGEDELLDQAEDAEVGVPPDLVERPPPVRRQECELFHPRQRLGHQRFGEVEPLVAADEVFDAPVDLLGRSQGCLIRVFLIHKNSPFVT